MHEPSHPPLSNYAKYLPEGELDLLTAQRPPPHWGPALKMASILQGMLCMNTTLYLIASLILAPPPPAHDQSVSAAEITWVVFGLLPGLGALLCWSLYRASKSTHGGLPS